MGCIYMCVKRSCNDAVISIKLVFQTKIPVINISRIPLREINWQTFLCRRVHEISLMFIA